MGGVLRGLTLGLCGNLRALNIGIVKEAVSEERMKLGILLLHHLHKCDVVLVK
jgi:hypothetical protein